MGSSLIPHVPLLTKAKMLRLTRLGFGIAQSGGDGWGGEVAAQLTVVYSYLVGDLSGC